MGRIRPQHLDQLCHRSLPLWVHLLGALNWVRKFGSPPVIFPSGWNPRNWLLASSARSRSRRSSTLWQWGSNSLDPCGFIPRFTCPRLNRSERVPWFLPHRLHHLLASSMEVPPTLSVASCSLAGVGGDSSTWWTGRVTALKKGPGSLGGTSWTTPSSGTSIDATSPRRPEPGHLPDHILRRSPRTTATTPRTGRVPPTLRRTTLSPGPWRWTLDSRTSRHQAHSFSDLAEDHCEPRLFTLPLYKLLKTAVINKGHYRLISRLPVLLLGPHHTCDMWWRWRCGEEWSMSRISKVSEFIPDGETHLMG